MELLADLLGTYFLNLGELLVYFLLKRVGILTLRYLLELSLP